MGGPDSKVVDQDEEPPICKAVSGEGVARNAEFGGQEDEDDGRERGGVKLRHCRRLPLGFSGGHGKEKTRQKPVVGYEPDGSEIGWFLSNSKHQLTTEVYGRDTPSIAIRVLMYICGFCRDIFGKLKFRYMQFCLFDERNFTDESNS